jgi:hypothetical protein
MIAKKKSRSIRRGEGVYTPLLFLFILCSVGCKQNQPKLIRYDLSQIDIELSSNRLIHYHSSVVYNGQGQSIFVGYNRFDHSFDFFDLSNQKVLPSLVLNREGENSVAYPVSSFSANEDYIVVNKSPGILYVLSHSGVVERILKPDFFKNIQGVNLSEIKYQGLSFSNYEFMYLNADDLLSVVLFPDFSRSKAEYYDEFGLSIVDVEKGSFESNFSLDYPKRILENKLGDLDEPHVISHDDVSTVSFSGSSEVIVIRSNSSPEYIELEAPEVFNPSSFNYSERDYSGRWQYLEKTARFFPLIYDQFRERYVRLAREKIYEDQSEQYYLLTYDESFNLINKLALPDYVDFKVYPSQEGLIIPYSSKFYNNESLISFLLVKDKVLN